MVLTVHYEADDLTETFLMADREESASTGLPIYSPHSPLGRALCGATAGDQREYLLPGGETMTVTLVNAVPYLRHRRPRTG
jgi:transcription elongation factor GreA